MLVYNVHMSTVTASFFGASVASFFFFIWEQVRHYHLKGAIGVKRLQTVGSERNVEFLCSLRPWPVKLYDAKF